MDKFLSPTEALSKDRYKKVYLVLCLLVIQGCLVGFSVAIHPVAALIAITGTWIYILLRKIEKSDWHSD